jgi:hypothetical protein
VVPILRKLRPAYMKLKTIPPIAIAAKYMLFGICPMITVSVKPTRGIVKLAIINGQDKDHIFFLLITIT